MDFYVLLGLGREATLTEIRRAYRRLARKYHPDINPGDRAAEAFFQSVVEAYETLNDPGPTPRVRRQRHHRPLARIAAGVVRRLRLFDDC